MCNQDIRITCVSLLEVFRNMVENTKWYTEYFDLPLYLLWDITNHQILLERCAQFPMLTSQLLVFVLYNHPRELIPYLVLVKLLQLQKKELSQRTTNNHQFTNFTINSNS